MNLIPVPFDRTGQKPKRSLAGVLYFGPNHATGIAASPRSAAESCQDANHNILLSRALRTNFSPVERVPRLKGNYPPTSAAGASRARALERHSLVETTLLKRSASQCNCALFAAPRGAQSVPAQAFPYLPFPSLPYPSLPFPSPTRRPTT